MLKIEYVPKRFRQETLDVIGYVEELLSEYEAAGFDLTIRQIYYEFVARNQIVEGRE
jgi:hypothetical protein